MDDEKMQRARIIDYIRTSCDELDEHFLELMEGHCDVHEEVLITFLQSAVCSISETLTDLLIASYSKEYEEIQNEFYQALAGLTQGDFYEKED